MAVGRPWICQQCALARRTTYRPPPKEPDVRCGLCGDPPSYLDYFIGSADGGVPIEPPKKRRK